MMIVSTSHIKRGIALFMLAVFALVFSPKELWHQCGVLGHEHNHGHDNDYHTSVTLNDDCAVCDFQLLPAPFAINEEVISKIEVFVFSTTSIGDQVFPGTYSTFSERGPPGFC